jgi:hypothetical protein
MHIAAIHIGKNEQIKSYAKEFSKLVSDNNNFVTIIDGLLETPRIAHFGYIAFFVDSGKPFSENYANELKKFLKEANIHNARHCSLFINKRMIVDKTFLAYMKILEEDGFILHFTEVLKNMKELKYKLENFYIPD